jgi:glutamine synthetase adenylyltransferase
MLNIETIEAAVAFDRLQAMRNASKTGGALGQVSNIELRLLSSSLGNLKQSNSKEEFQRNLDQVKKVYNEIVHGKDYQDPSDTNNDLSDDEKKYLGL